MKNRKIYFILFTLVFLLGLVQIIIIFNEKTKIYRNNIINNNAYIINAIIEKHPELEKEIIEDLIQNKKNVDRTILEKYGLDNTDIISYYDVENNNLLKDEIIKYLVFVLSLVFIYVLYVINENRKIKQIDKYIKDILNNKDTFDIRDYNEDELSKLKNDIYKITMLLKEEKENTLSEKKNLEVILSDISHQIKTAINIYVCN